MDNNNSNIIDYIKKNYPKIVFSPFKFSYTKALGFIVSNNKLVIGFINADGTIGKLIEPIDITEMKNGNVNNVLEKIPIVEGFSKVDKDNLLNFFKNAQNLTCSNDEHNKIKKDLEEAISEKTRYKLLYDSQNNEIIAIKNKYESKIEGIQSEYFNKFDSFSSTVINNFDKIKNSITEYKNTIE